MENESNLKFNCPNCGDITQDDVAFLCNHCDSQEMIHKEGAYICPQCMVPGENFMCLKCDSKKVTLKNSTVANV